MQSTQIIIKFKDKSSLEKSIYTVIFHDLEKQIIGLGDNLDLLMGVRSKLQEALAIVENRYYKVKHPEFTRLPYESPTPDKFF